MRINGGTQMVRFCPKIKHWKWKCYLSNLRCNRDPLKQLHWGILVWHMLTSPVVFPHCHASEQRLESGKLYGLNLVHRVPYSVWNSQLKSREWSLHFSKTSTCILPNEKGLSGGFLAECREFTWVTYWKL